MRGYIKEIAERWVLPLPALWTWKVLEVRKLGESCLPSIECVLRYCAVCRPHAYRDSNIMEGTGRRVARYVTPVIIFSSIYNIPKFYEYKVSGNVCLTKSSICQIITSREDWWNLLSFATPQTGRELNNKLEICPYFYTHSTQLILMSCVKGDFSKPS